MKYLKGTKDFCLSFSKKDNELVGFVDADWANNISDRKSYTGFVFKLGDSAISWESSKQKTVALSSSEAEYMAITEATKEAIYLKNFLSELIGYNKTVYLFNDNQSAIALSANPIYHKRSKHIDIKYHFIRDVIADNIITLKYLQTDLMPADLLTKGLSKEKHNRFLNDIGLLKK